MRYHQRTMSGARIRPRIDGYAIVSREGAYATADGGYHWSQQLAIPPTSAG